MVQLARRYLDGGFEEAEHAVPSASGLARYLGVTRSTLYNWAEKGANQYSDDIAEVMAHIQAEQEVLCLSKGLTGKFNPAIVGKLLSNHGYSERHALEHTGKDGGAIRTEAKIEWTIQPVKPVNEADADG